jgi:hypothetical protein
VGVFYLSVLPQFLPSNVNPLAGSMLLAGVHAAEGMLWFALLITAINRVRRTLTRPRVKQWLERATGAVLIGLGIRPWPPVNGVIGAMVAALELYFDPPAEAAHSQAVGRVGGRGRPHAARSDTQNAPPHLSLTGTERLDPAAIADALKDLTRRPRALAIRLDYIGQFPRPGAVARACSVGRSARASLSSARPS